MTPEQIAGDARWKYNDFPTEPIVISDREYQCIRIASLSERRPLEIGGFQEEPEVTVTISNIDLETGERVFPVLPKAGTRATLAGVTYEIDRVERPAYGSDVVMDLRSATK